MPVPSGLLRAGLDPGNGCTDQGENVRCNAKNVVLVSITTGDMNDTIRVAGIEAFVDAGTGNDRVVTSAQATVLGGPGNDRLEGGDRKDLFRGGAHDDVLTGGDGTDVLKGGAGDDLIRAQDNERDRVNGGADDDYGQLDCKDRSSRIEERAGGCA